MRRKLAIAVAGLAAAILAWEFVPIQVKRWDGGFDVTVRIQCPEGRPRSVSVEAHTHRKYAEEAVEHLLPPEPGLRSVVADPFDGQPLIVRVPAGWEESPFGRELRRWQFQSLAVIAVLPDGRRVGKVVDLPDVRVSRRVAVTLP